MHSILVMKWNVEEKRLESGESPLWGDIYEDTVAIYESPTARSDHDSFQNIGVAT